MKDEFKGIPVNKFIELRSKMYCIVSDIKVTQQKE